MGTPGLRAFHRIAAPPPAHIKKKIKWGIP
jgi:hypothetical protein